jgi:hypothetical protein
MKNWSHCHVPLSTSRAVNTLTSMSLYRSHFLTCKLQKVHKRKKNEATNYSSIFYADSYSIFPNWLKTIFSIITFHLRTSKSWKCAGVGKNVSISSLPVSSEGKTSLGCRAENWTRACLTYAYAEHARQNLMCMLSIWVRIWWVRWA